MAPEQRLIDANHIVEVAEHAYSEWNLAMAAADGQRQISQVYKMKELCKAVKAVADAAPTVDAVEVVRCKDCKDCDTFYPRKEIGKEPIQVWYCNRYRCHRDPDDFCSHGERRTDDVQ